MRKEKGMKDIWGMSTCIEGSRSINVFTFSHTHLLHIWGKKKTGKEIVSQFVIVATFCAIPLMVLAELDMPCMREKGTSKL